MSSPYEDLRMQTRTGIEKQNGEIFLKAVRRLHPERSAHHCRVWLFRVVRTTIVDYWRAHYR